MSDDPPSHAWRPTLRLPTYDYGQPGGYFITICTLARVPRFGSVQDGEMQPNPAGLMLTGVWQDLPSRFPRVIPDAFIAMPNHVHGILLVTDHGPHLGSIVGAYKSITTHRYVLGVRHAGWPRYDGKLWQDNYFEHIIRDDEALDRIREYIVANPTNWERDPERLGE